MAGFNEFKGSMSDFAKEYKDQYWKDQKAIKELIVGFIGIFPPEVNSEIATSFAIYMAEMQVNDELIKVAVREFMNVVDDDQCKELEEYTWDIMKNK